MPLRSTWALQQGLYDALVSNGTVTNLLGGPKVYDDVPRNVTYPFLTLAQTSSQDYGTSTDDGEEHVVTLHVWSRAGGKKQSQEIIGAVRDVLHDQPLSLVDHHLVNLRHEFSDTRRDPDGEHYHGIIRYRAVTEPTN